VAALVGLGRLRKDSARSAMLRYSRSHLHQSRTPEKISLRRG
jgi:hypothetical protein